MGYRIRIPHVVITFFFLIFALINFLFQLPSLCSVVSSNYVLFVPHFAMAVFMCIYYIIVQINNGSLVVRVLLNSLVCWSFKTFNHGLNHSKIHTARQFWDFQCLFLFRQSCMVKPRPGLNLYELALLGNELVRAKIYSM